MRGNTGKLSPELARIKEAYEREKKLLGRSKRKEWLRQIDATKKTAEDLRQYISVLPMEEFYDFDENGNPDYACLTILNDQLDCLLHRLDVYEPPRAKNTKGIAENHLVKRLWRICPDPKCYNSPGIGVAGSFVTFLEETLPKLDIPVAKVQAFAERARKLKLK